MIMFFYNLMIIYLINWLADFSIKHQEIVKNVIPQSPRCNLIDLYSPNQAEDI